MKMNQVELNAYRMIFRNGTVKQVRQALEDIVEVEPAITEELMVDIIAMLRNRGKEALRELARSIQDLLGKTQSMELYKVADELGYLELDRAQSRVYLSGKVNLFVNQLFYHPDVEPMVIDELYKWVNYVEQTVRQAYPDAYSFGIVEEPEYDKGLKTTELFSEPLYPVGRILRALDKIASPEGRETLRTLEYTFRPRVNVCLAIEMAKMARSARPAVKLPEQTPVAGSAAVLAEIVEAAFATPTVHHLKEIVDRMGEIARSGSALGMGNGEIKEG